ncbi:MAG: DUF5411 family protein [Clostridium sp.]|nr:MAG: DUF5411 family protein [Clostridium sp.]
MKKTFYLGREVMEASMIDAVDYGTFRKSGKIVMSKEKFVEVFVRRFAESITNNKDYQLDFFMIYMKSHQKQLFVLEPLVVIQL